jgi:glutamine phosphoribosylpyrophosphate amidotransferase
LLEVPPDQSDTDVVAQLLSEEMHMHSNDSSLTSTMEAVAATISRIWNCEFAFCFLTENALYYERDCLGRRSLLTSQENDGVWKLFSVAISLNESWLELPPGRIFVYNLTSHAIQSLPLPAKPSPLCCRTTTYLHALFKHHAMSWKACGNHPYDSSIFSVELSIADSRHLTAMIQLG